jgi:MoxR-like ATPase
LSAHSVLHRLGAVGLEPIEPVILAAIANRDPLLLIGSHGSGKSWLLNRIAATLGLEVRHYNASLLSFDDLVGYPLPDAAGQLRFVQTPASIWGAQAVFIDEISRCRPETQNKLFSIVHERRIQGIALERLEHRWSAMNPPSVDDDASGYAGSEPLDRALADRFAFIVEVPSWEKFGEQDQLDLILTREAEPNEAEGRVLARAVASVRMLATQILAAHSDGLARYIRLLSQFLRQAQLELSGRRAVQLVRNIGAVHAARQSADPAAEFAESALLAVTHSLPQRATGEPVPAHKLLPSHREAWKAAQLGPSSPMAALLSEVDPLRRALMAARIPKLKKSEFSAIVTDCLAQLAPGARHALAAELFESGAAGRLVAAAATQCGEWYALVATPHEIRESLSTYSSRYRIWQKVVARLASFAPGNPETPARTNLLTGLFAAGELGTEDDVDRALAAWQDARKQLAAGGTA